MNLKDKLTFGKYNGKCINYICYVNPRYIFWLLNNVKGIELDKDVKRKAPQRYQMLKRNNKRLSNADWMRSLTHITDN